MAPEMKKRAKEAKKGDYTSGSEYLRSMIAAGESRMAALDPRTQDRSSGDIPEVESVEEVAKALADTVLLAELSEDSQGITDVLEGPTTEFQTVLANRLDAMAADESSPVERDALTEEYTLDVEE